MTAQFDPTKGNRSPHLTFPRSSWEPQVSDRDLLPKPDLLRPSKERMPWGGRERGGAAAGELHPDGPGPLPEGFLSANDLGRLPWTRRRGDEWTTSAFRAEVLAFISRYFRARAAHRLIGWDVVEKATGERSARRLAPRAQFLRFGVTQRTGEDTSRRVEVAQAFPPAEREGAALTARLAAVEGSLDVLLAIV